MQSDRVITRRHLGWASLALGMLGVIGLLALNLIRASDRQIGPAQKLGFVACALLIIAGITLSLLPMTAEWFAPCEIPAAQPEDSRNLRWIQRGLLVIALVLMLFHTVVYTMYAVSLAQFPFDYDQGEGFELNDTVLLSQGQWPYRDNAVYPFYASNYPPLFHVVLVPFVWLFGPAYWYGRLVGFASTLITASAIGYAVYRATRHKPVALLSGLAFLASNYVYHIGPLFRQHISMVMFETLAVVMVAGIESAPQSKRRRVLIVTLIFLLAAGYTKQLAVATAGAVFVYLFMIMPRRAIVWGAILAAVAGLIFLWINLSTGGQWWTNIITANVNQYFFGQFRGLLGQFISLHGTLLILAVLLIAYELYFDRLSIYSIWFVAAGIDAVLAGKWGAGDSYFSTMIAAMCILAGIFVGRTLNRAWRWPPALGAFAENRLRSLTGLRRPVSILVGLTTCTLFILYGLAVVKIPLNAPIVGDIGRALGFKGNTKFADFYDSAGWVEGYATIGQIPTAESVKAGWQIVAEIKAVVKDTQTPILSEEAAFSFRTNKPIITNPTQLKNLFENQHFDPSALIKMIEDQAFGAVIFRASFYPPPVVEAVKRAYKEDRRIMMNGYEYTILVPDPTWPSRRK